MLGGDRVVPENVEDCVFCQIVLGNSPGSVFYEDDVVMALMTIGPITEGHTMVIPKTHSAYLADLEEQTGRHLWTVAQRAAAAIRVSGLQCEGVNFFLADGEAAFQEIFHVHLHVFPRFEGDSFRLVADWGKKPTRSELDEVAVKLRSAYDHLWAGNPVITT